MPLDTVLGWENQTASEFSPGIVAHDEDLYHQLVDPTNWNAEAKELKPTAFDAVFTLGLSVDRASYSSVADMRQRALVRIGDEKKLIGFCVFKCSTLREFVASPGSNLAPIRVLCVFDTAYKDHRCHSDVCYVAEVEAAEKKRVQRSVRSHLFDVGNSTFTEE